MKTTLLLLACALPLSVVACASPSSAEDDASDVGTDDLTGSSALVGTWAIDDGVDGEGQMMVSWLTRVAFEKNGTCWFDEEAPVFDQDGMNSQIGHFDAPCTYEVKKGANGDTWINLAYQTPDHKKTTSKYFYKGLRGGKVTLAADVRGRERDNDWYGMHKTDDRAWCAAAADCDQQNLPKAKANGTWACEQIRPDKVLTYTIPACVLH